MAGLCEGGNEPPGSLNASNYIYSVELTLEYCNGVDLSASTVRRYLLRAGLVARMPLRRLPLSRNHQRLRLQWTRERRHWRAEWQNVVFSDESRFNLYYNDGRMRVRRYRGERNLRACIVERHSGQMPSGNLNSNRYIREVLEPEVLPLLQAIPHAIFQQDGARPHVAKIVQAFSEERRVSLLPWPARPPNMLPIELVWDMVGRQLVRHGLPAPTLDALWTRIQTSWKVLLLVDIMPHGTTINSDAYVATLKKLQVRLSRVRRHREKQDVLLLHDNAQPYVSHKTTDQIRKFG
ncbi:hypothetical protein ANN_09709 [Periplaneta americana]|uniref:Transposase Tc1-like domain-containing protein n=1 Tax=Periplaneta americana TaxID=6978 RepID=A0ABQ8TM17_PERAM|nr:hypothetical protein ANN_09709 [Periplaneta americana]